MDEDSAVALSDLQIDLLKVLWARGEATPAEVTEALVASHGLAHTTVATLLTRLEKRGLLACDRSGRQLRYQPRVSESQVRRTMVARLLGSLFGGDPKALLSHLVRDSEIRPDDLEAARRQLERTDPERPA
jgi:BlaI family transcriptional regulator, penicillinase repressor